jgi:hypothetical protein
MRLATRESAAGAVLVGAMVGLLLCGDDARSKPFATPETLDIGQGLPGGSLTLYGPIVVQASLDTSFERAQGDWAALTIQSNVNLSPAKSELARMSATSDVNAGEELADDTWVSPLQATRVKNPSVILEIPVSFTGTSTQVTGLNYSCSTGGQCVPADAGDGNVGVYSARVETCLSDSNGTSLKRVKDEHGNAIKCSTAGGVQGNKGFWYDVSKPWSSTAYLTTPFSNPTATVKGKLSIPVNLPTPVNSLRVEFRLGLKDQDYHSAGNGIATTNPGPNDPFVKTYWGTLTYNSNGVGTVTGGGGPESVVTRFAVQLPNITVLPAAFLAMKVLPYTIVYRPPGDQSTGTFKMLKSFGTSLNTGVSTAIDNTSAFQESMGVQSTTKVNALIAAVQVQDTASSMKTNATDDNATIGTGLVTANSRSVARSWQLGSSSPSDPTIFPAKPYVVPNTCTNSSSASAGCKVEPGETFDQEPFWADQIVVLLDVESALWDFNGSTTMQLLGAQDFDAISVKDLDACAINKNKYGWTLINGAKLTPVECSDLLALDPYFTFGQSYDPSATNRGVSEGGGSYGRDPRNPNGASPVTSFQDIITQQTQQSTNASASYQASVTSVTGFSWSGGLGLNAKHDVEGLDLSFSSDLTVTQGWQQTEGSQLKITYSASSVATDINSTEIDGALSDDHNFDTPACQTNSVNCYTPRVNVYVDELFGGYMFSDPDAALNPLLVKVRNPNLNNNSLPPFVSGSSSSQTVPTTSSCPSGYVMCPRFNGCVAKSGCPVQSAKPP